MDVIYVKILKRVTLGLKMLWVAVALVACVAQDYEMISEFDELFGLDVISVASDEVTAAFNVKSMYFSDGQRFNVLTGRRLILERFEEGVWVDAYVDDMPWLYYGLIITHYDDAPLLLNWTGYVYAMKPENEYRVRLDLSIFSIYQNDAKDNSPVKHVVYAVL